MKRPTFDELLLRYSKMSERRRKLGLVGGLALVVVAYGIGVFWDQHSQSDALSAQLQTLETQRAEKAAYAGNLKRYKARLAELTEQLALAQAMLPDDPDVAQFLAQLGSKAHEVGLTLERFEPKGEIIHDFYGELSFNVQTKGTYHQLGTLLDQLAKMDRIINVGQLTFFDPKMVAHKVVLTSTFVLRIYRSLTPEQQKKAREQKKAQEKS